MGDFNNEYFKTVWGKEGYEEPFNACYNNFSTDPAVAVDLKATIIKKLDELAGLDTCLEIGCGDGKWTVDLLVPRFKKVIAVDVKEIPSRFKGIGNINYIQLTEDHDYGLESVEDNSIDFIYSFGVMVHLSQNAQMCYLEAMQRVLKSGGVVLASFANWPRHPELSKVTPVFPYKNSKSFYDWFYNDVKDLRKMLNEVGLVDFVDLLPTARDTLAMFKKV